MNENTCPYRRPWIAAAAALWLISGCDCGGGDRLDSGPSDANPADGAMADGDAGDGAIPDGSRPTCDEAMGGLGCVGACLEEDPALDRCGACGTSCAGGGVCHDGVCLAACPGLVGHGLPRMEGAGGDTFAIADLDGDGALDLVSLAEERVLVSLARDGRLVFVAGYPGFREADARVTDLDGDGDPDLFVDSSTIRDYRVYLNDGAGGLTAFDPMTRPLGNPIVVGDIDGDGRAELIGGGSRLRIAFGPPTAGALDFRSTDGMAGRGHAVAQLDDDAALEVVGVTSSEIHVYDWDGADLVEASVTVLPEPIFSGLELTVGDFDGDGLDDLIVSPQSAGATLFSGVGGGALAAGVALGWPLAIRRAQDLNGDGRDDVIEWADVLTLRHASLTGFEDPIAYGVEAGPPRLVDLDGDGRRDLLEQLPEGLRISDGTDAGLAPLRVAGGGHRSIAVRCVDLDGDGVLEVLASDYYGDRATIFSADGGMLTARASLANPRGPLTYADPDGDGRLDLFLGGSAGISIARQQGDGTFAPFASIAATSTQQIAAGVAGTNHELFVAENDGRLVARTLASDGTLGAEVAEIALTEPPQEIVVSDLDGDGDLDAVIRVRGGGIQLLLRDAATLTAGAMVPSDRQGLALVDLELDGVFEVATTDGVHGVTGGALTPRVVLPHTFLPRDFVGVISPASEPRLVYTAGVGVLVYDLDGAITATYGGGAIACAADLDADSRTDVVRRLGGGIRLAPGLVAGALPLPELSPVVRFGTQVITADVDGDGRSEAVLAALDGTVFWLPFRDGRFEPVALAELASSPRGVQVADVDLDGQLEVLVTGSNYRGLAYDDRTLLHDPPGTLPARELPGVGYIAAFGDFDGDRWPDYALLSRIVGMGGFYLSDGAIPTWSQGVELRDRFGLAVGDLDGDGRAEVVQDATFGSPQLQVYALAPDGSTTEPVVFDTPGGAASKRVVDVTADGLADLLAIAGREESSLLLLRGASPIDVSAGALGQRALGFAASSIQLVELDGAAPPELLVSGARRHVLLRVRADGTIDELGSVDAPGLAAVGDFDGDGAADWLQVTPVGLRMLPGTCP